MTEVFRCSTASRLETEALGERLAQCLQDGDVLLLSGKMGAGKSELARGIARGLGIGGPVPSPSFTILNVYQDGTLPLKHFDWYRVHSPEELFESGLDEMIGEEGVTAIEWHERASELLPAACLEVEIVTLGEDGREIIFRTRGDFRMLPFEQILTVSKG